MTASKVGFTVQPNAATDVTVEGNRIVPGSSPAADAAGMYLTGVNGGAIRGNIVSGFTGGNAIGGSHLTGFLIEENQLIGCRKGVNHWGNTTFIEVRENLITGHSTEGIVLKGQDLSIHDNVVTGNATGIKIDVNTLVTQRVTVHANDLSGNSLLSLEVTPAVLEVVDATGDYWGTMVKSEIAARTSGLVSFIPWCNADFSICNYGFPVNNLTQGTGYLAIQPAIDAANPAGGDVVQVDAGVYNERLTINKPMTLRGATSGVSKRGFTVPPAYAYDAATQSIVRPGTTLERAVVHVAADGVVFDGFVVANEVCATGGVYQDLVAIDQSLAAPTGVQILNCVLGPNTNTASQDGTKGRSGVTVYGPHGFPVKLVVMRNKIFDSKGNGCGIMIVGPYGPSYAPTTPEENYFAGSVIEDNDILGNHRTGIEFAGGVQGGTAWDDHVIIRNNLIADNGWFSVADKDNLKYGHGVMLIRASSDKGFSDAAGSRYVRLENNVVRDNEKSGLYVGPKNRDVFGTGNLIRDNGKGTGGYSLWDGVRVDLDELYYPSGTYTDYGFLANVSFVDGGILGNGALGVRVMQTPAAGPVVAGCNWWGNVLGPNVPPANPSPGDGITGLATYAPWWSTASGPCDGYGPNTVAPVAPATCVTPAHACVPVPVDFNRTDPTPVRGYSVTLTLSGNLSLCGSGIVEGGFLSGVGSTNFGPVLSLGGGVYTVDCAILGATVGATGSGTLFTVNLAGAVTGTGTVTVNSVTVRDVDNAPVAGIPGPPATITIDNTVPTAVVLAAVQKKSGNDGDGTTKIDLSWSGTVTPGDSVLIYRAGWGNYPEYDDVGGGVPATPTYPPGAPWALAGKVVGASVYADESAARDFWYYVAFVKDPCGNVGPISNRTAGTLNYHLGDVHNGLANCAGDNQVTLGQDISFLGTHYGITLTPGDPWNCLDVGPTTNYSVNARPTTDNRVNFEDLMMFAINFGVVTAPQSALRPVAAGSDELWLEGPAKVTAGTTFTVSLRMKGAGDLQGLSAQLGWDRAVVEPVSVEAGALAGMQNAVVMSGAAGSVDAALLGANRGLMGEGVLATVTFRALANGAPGVTLAKVDARNLGNQPVTLAGVKPAEVPGATWFAPAMPNPFRGATTLSYALAQGGAVELVVYGVDGRKVATLASGVQAAGSYRLSWDGAGARPGLYYARLTTPEGRFTRTLVLTR